MLPSWTFINSTLIGSPFYLLRVVITIIMIGLSASYFISDRFFVGDLRGPLGISFLCLCSSQFSSVAIDLVFLLRFLFFAGSRLVNYRKVSLLTRFAVHVDWLPWRWTLLRHRIPRRFSPHPDTLLYRYLYSRIVSTYRVNLQKQPAE